MMPLPQDNPHRFPIVYPRGRGGIEFGRRAPSMLAKTGAFLYRSMSETIRRSRLSKRPNTWAGMTVVSVGNLEVGGNGKTPFAMHLLDTLLSGNDRPIYISRGFKSVAESFAGVTVVAPDSTGVKSFPAGVRWMKPDARDLASQVGDEGAVLAARFPTVPLFFSRNKMRALRVAHDVFGPTHAILDDAFQTWQVPRDVDVVLLDAANPFGNGALVPAGTLREVPASLSRADYVGINNYGPDMDLGDYAAVVRRAADREIPVFGIQRSVEWYDPDTQQQLSAISGRVACLSAIARHAAFEAALAASGAEIALSMRYPDHHAYNGNDVTVIARELAAHNIECVAITEKDWVKLQTCDSLPVKIAIGRLGLRVVGVDSRVLTKKPQARPAAF